MVEEVILDILIFFNVGDALPSLSQKYPCIPL